MPLYHAFRRYTDFHNLTALLTKAYLLVGMNYYSAQNYKEAISVWEMALSVDPDNRKVRRYLSKANEEVRRLDRVFNDGCHQRPLLACRLLYMRGAAPIAPPAVCASIRQVVAEPRTTTAHTNPLRLLEKMSRWLLVTLLIICATSILSPISTNAATVNSVQNGTTTSSGNGTITVPIAAVDTTKSFLVFGTRHDSNSPPGSMIGGRIASPTTVEFVRTTNETSTMTIHWYVVEYSSGVSVQRGVTVQSATTIDVPLVTPVSSLSQAFVLWSKTPGESESNQSDDEPLVSQLTTTSNLQFRVNDWDANQMIWWQVVEFTESPGH